MEKQLNTDILDRAIIFAVKAHSGVERRGKGFPYIVHPMEAVEIVATITSDQELLAAAALHDTVEDSDVTIDEIEKNFGKRVASLVATESDIEIPNMSQEESWHIRKAHAIERLANATYEEKVVAIGDKLSNMRAISRDYSIKGDKLWELFHVKEKEEHAWHYKALLKAFDDLKGTFPYEEFKMLVERVFGVY